MSKMNIKLDLKKFEKQLSKSINKIVEDKQKKLNIESSIRMDNDMIILNEIEEEVLSLLLKNYDKGTNEVEGEYNAFPDYICRQIKDIFYKLKVAGYIADFGIYLSNWYALLTPIAKTYFKDKSIYFERRNEMEFYKLPSNSRKFLDELLKAENKEDYINQIRNNPEQEDEINSILRELKANGFINTFFASDEVYKVEINNLARTYFERENEYMENRNKQGVSNTYNISNTGNFVIGDVTNSSLTINSSIEKIEKDIDKNGKEDKDELKEILLEVKDYLETIEKTSTVSKNTGLFKRLTKHFDNHGWFYAEVVALIGQVCIKSMGGN
ncbi:MAG: hypothetical protein K0R72_573 [Clostridia bacterium]|jgi:hypothetical protein|nr:hypothetical protein [Clostridia bacterium]